MDEKRGGAGGARPGSGRPKKEKRVVALKQFTPLSYLLSVMNDSNNSTARRMRAAVSCLPYTHCKADRNAKKTTQEKAKIAAKGKYAPARAPSKVIQMRTKKPGEGDFKK